MQERLNRLLKNRGGALIAGVVVALLAVILLVIYLNSYRSSVNSGKQLQDVLVATKLIPRGTSGKVIASEGLYRSTKVQKDQLQPFAIADPSAIQGRVAAGDVFPGQQLTQSDFTTEDATSIPSQISGAQRAIAIPVDSAHGLVGQVAAGNFVDVYVGTNGSAGAGGASQTLLTLLAADIEVLVAPGAGSPNAILRVTTKQAPVFAFAADNTRIWLVLRPQTGASRTPPATVTLGTLLANASATK